MAAAKSSFSSAMEIANFDWANAANSAFSAGSDSNFSVTSDEGLAVLLFLNLENIDGAFVARQQIDAVVGFEEGLQCLDPGDQPHQIVFVAKREHRIDQ